MKIVWHERCSGSIRFLPLAANPRTWLDGCLLCTIGLHVLFFYSARPPALVAGIRACIGTRAVGARSVLALLMLHSSALCRTSHVRWIVSTRKIEMSLGWWSPDRKISHPRSSGSGWILLSPLIIGVIDSHSCDILLERSVRREIWMLMGILVQIIHLYHDFCKLMTHQKEHYSSYHGHVLPREIEKRKE